MAKEATRTGFVERATVEIIEPKAAPVSVGCWYWYNGEPIYAFLDNDTVTFRGYNFTTKEEWRRSDIDASTLRLCE